MVGSNNADSPDGTAQLSLLFITQSGLMVCHYKCCHVVSQKQPFEGSKEGLCAEVVQANFQHCDTTSMSIWQ